MSKLKASSSATISSQMAHQYRVGLEAFSHASRAASIYTLSVLQATEIALAAWEDGFRAAAAADDCQLLKSHLRSLELPEEPGFLLEGRLLG